MQHTTQTSNQANNQSWLNNQILAVINLSHKNWQIYITTREQMEFTEAQLTSNRWSFETVFPEKPNAVIIISYALNEAYIRFLVDKQWVDGNRCCFDNLDNSKLPKHGDLRLKIYKWALEKCIDQAIIKSELDTILAQKKAGVLPNKLDDNHRVARAIKAVMQVYPDDIERTFKATYDSLVEPLEKTQEPITTADTSISLTTLMDNVEETLKEKTPVVITADQPTDAINVTPQDVPMLSSTEPSTEEDSVQQANIALNAIETTEPEAELSSKNTAPSLRDSVKSQVHKEECDFLTELKTILINAHKQNQVEFFRHTGLQNMYKILVATDDNNLYGAINALKKEATLRSTGFQNWLSHSTFCCLTKGRDPAVDLLYRYIRNTKVTDLNANNHQMVLNNLRELITDQQKNAMRRIDV